MDAARQERARHLADVEGDLADARTRSRTLAQVAKDNPNIKLDKNQKITITPALMSILEN
jgi:hypothetical protein